MGLFSKSKQETINWKPLNQMGELSNFIDYSKQKPVAIFKHSTRCALSSMAKSRLERGWDLNDEDIDMYYLDLLNYRDISNEIASFFSIEHQSPQLILISNGEVACHVSHGDIDVKVLKDTLEK